MDMLPEWLPALKSMMQPHFLVDLQDERMREASLFRMLRTSHYQLEQV